MIKYDIGMVSLSETPFIGDDGDNAGLYFNREFAYEYYRYTKEYDSNEPTKYMNRGFTKNSQNC